MNDSDARSAVIVLKPPEPVAALAPEQIEDGDTVALTGDDRAKFEEHVQEFVRGLLDAQLHCEAFNRFGDILKAYVQRYQSLPTHVNAVLDTLLHGKDELLSDNASPHVNKGSEFSATACWDWSKH